MYGWGAPGASVTVTVLTADTGVTELTAPPSRVGTNGEWKVMLPPHAAGTGFTLTATAQGVSASATAGGVRTTAKITLERVAFGDVWFCSGQSNMELGLYYTFTRNESLAAIASNKYNNIRIMHFDHNPLEAPTFVTNGSIATNYPDNSSWLTPAAAMQMKKKWLPWRQLPERARWFLCSMLVFWRVADQSHDGRFGKQRGCCRACTDWAD